MRGGFRLTSANKTVEEALAMERNEISYDQTFEKEIVGILKDDEEEKRRLGSETPNKHMPSSPPLKSSNLHTLEHSSDPGHVAINRRPHKVLHMDEPQSRLPSIHTASSSTAQESPPSFLQVKFVIKDPTS
jgi:hypothetical protein